MKAMIFNFEIPQGACNVASFIENQTVLTVESWEHVGDTLRVVFHRDWVTSRSIAQFQAAIDAEYLVEKPLELIDNHQQLRVVVLEGDGFLAFETTCGAGGRQVVCDFTIDNKALRALHVVPGLKELLMSSMSQVVAQIKR